MAYFTNDMENIRLVVLYMLKALNVKVTATQLTTAVMEASELNYFDVQLAVSELEDSGFIASVDGVRDAVYAITPNGDTMLSIMMKRMPRSLKLTCDEYAKEQRKKILNLGYFSARSNKNPSGGYDAVLTSVENDRIILSVVVNVADQETCDKICSSWEERSGEVYEAVFKILTDK